MKIKRNLKKDKLVGGKRNIIIILILFILGISNLCEVIDIYVGW